MFVRTPHHPPPGFVYVCVCVFVCVFAFFFCKVENDEIIRMDSERRRLKDEDEEEVQRGRRLTYDHGQAFGGDSSPFRVGNYEALVGYLTEIGESNVDVGCLLLIVCCCCCCCCNIDL